MKQRRIRCERGGSPTTRQIRSGRRGGLLACCGLVLASVVALVLHLHSTQGQGAAPGGLSELLALSPARLGRVLIADLNLLCVTGLRPDNEPDRKVCQATLQTWAARVRSETERHRYRFETHPAEFEHSEGFFRMLMLCVVLAEDYGVHYDAQRQAGPAASRSDDGFFADPGAVFLHGLLGPERRGTCSSMPVLYVALGRELGYPLKLVTTKGHLFVRWEGNGERFNIEGTSHGLNRFDDDYYRHWPFEVTPDEEKAEGYLKSLTPFEEFAVFLSIRGMCLREQGRFPEAAEAFSAAARFAPSCGSYQRVAADLARRSHPRKPSIPVATSL
jgi:hypothetical protein